MTATTDAPVTPTLEKRLRRAARRQAGMTLLEIMIVLAILALVMGFLVGPRIYRAFQESKEDTQRAIVKKYVYEGFVDWARRNPTKGCPSNIQEVSEQMGRADSKDTWGRELIWYCRSLPAAAERDGFAVASLGEDGLLDTADDIRSWE